MTGFSLPHLRTHIQASVLLPALVILAGLLLRVIMLGQAGRFHPDEALFAAQARLITYHGDWLLRTTDLDKPPLTFYATALSFRVLGTSEIAARLPNVIFSVLAVAALYALVYALYTDRLTAALAALLLAISPFDLAFAATLFTDVQATFWVILAAWLAARDRWTAAGIAAALIAAAKPNAMLALPLIVALGIARQARAGWTLRDLVTRLACFAGPLMVGLVLLIGWDAARAPRSFFELGWQRNDPGRFIRAEEIWPRLRAWGHWAVFMTGSPLLNGALIIVLFPWLINHACRHRTRAAALDWLTVTFCLAFFGWHWLIAFNTYDRYLHTLTPFLLMLVARLLVAAWRVLRAASYGAPRWTCLVAVGLLSALLLPGTLTTLRGEAPIGGDQGKHNGIDTLASTLNTLNNVILFDHWLGWELAYYLGAETALQVRYTPQPEALADALPAESALTQDGRYFVAPSPEDAELWLFVLRHAEIIAEVFYHDADHGFVVYHLILPPQ